MSGRSQYPDEIQNSCGKITPPAADMHSRLMDRVTDSGLW